MITFESANLRLRPFRESDFPFAFRMQSSEEIMHYIRAATSDESEVRARTDMWLSYAAQNPGYGVWIMELKTDHTVVGYGVVRHVEFTPGKEIEIGYIVAREYWGKGFATEASRAMIAYAEKQLGVQELVAYTSEENTGSNRVLEKCGFQRMGIERVYDADCLRWWKRMG
ncbi:MAG: GNAT family N-acetyltransferase [Saprospiraceae bacterium]|nr:GNAT family N-acetyltransferase [Saprospiraceae bacterium]